MDLIITPSGTVRTLYAETIDLTVLGPAQIVRASHVEPTADGNWTADLSPVGGPFLGPFVKRTEALTAEVDWLNTYWLPR